MERDDTKLIVSKRAANYSSGENELQLALGLSVPDSKFSPFAHFSARSNPEISPAATPSKKSYVVEVCQPTPSKKEHFQEGAVLVKIEDAKAAKERNKRRELAKSILSFAQKLRW